jgi:hypothetical protein
MEQQKTEAQPDWLLDDSSYKAGLSDTGNTNEIVLSNGLISRTFRVAPNGATVAFDKLITGASILRGVKPEAMVELDGVKYEVGGLKGQVEYAYLRPEWVDSMTADPKAFRFVGFRTDKIKARFPWKRKRYCEDRPWPPKGVELVMDYRPPAGAKKEHQNLTVSAHYALYDGIPLLSKWITVRNGGDKPVTLNTFVSEILATVDYEVPEELMHPDPWHPVNIHVESDYSFFSNPQVTVHWVYDPAYNTQQYHASGRAPNTLMSHLPLGPDVDIRPGDTFKSFRTFELVYDSTERERKSLALRRMYRTVAPWVTENPIFWHAASAEPAYIRRAIDQSAEVGFEMLIMTFGSRLNMLSEDPDYIATYKELADYAHSKGIELGGYSLLASSNPGPTASVVMPTRAELDGAVYSGFPHEPFIKQWLKSPKAEPRTIFGHSPCLCSKWADDYFRKLEHFIEKTGFDLLEHDGSYPGDVCASVKHNGHKGLADSQWLQRERMRTFYGWCRAKGVYLNVPDWYMLTGSSKTCMTYREENNALPRERQIILFRQNIYDGTWNKTPSMGWMFLPLMNYKGGGAAATIEPLHEHLDTYRWHLAQNFGSGVQSVYRGPRLYDTEETKAVVRKWVDFYKKYRAILDSDIIHVRRPDGRDIDCILHVNPKLKQKGLAMVYNPTGRTVERTLRLPLYYTGLTETASVREQEGSPGECVLDRQFNIQIPIKMDANAITWFVIE